MDGSLFRLAAPGASVVALDARDGSTVWAVGDDEASYCPIYPITIRGRRLGVAFLRNTIVVHDLAMGKILFREELSRHYDEHSAWPLYAEPHLFITSPFRAGARVYRFEDTKSGLSARSVWENRQLSNDVCSSVLVYGQVYGFDLHQAQASAHRTSRGRFKCLEFATGKVRWETDKVGQATILVADGKLILLNDTGTLILAKATPAAYEELARTKMLDGGLCWTPPTLSNGRLFVRNHSRAICVFLGQRESLDPNREFAELPRTASFDWPDLLSREPNYPHDAPSSEELALWFGWCVFGVFAAAGVLAGMTGLLAWLARSRQPMTWAKTTFASSAFLLGLAGTTFASAWADTFILTWPASLFVAFRLTISLIVWVEARPREKRPRWASRTVTLLFLASCYGYYRVCLAVGYVMAWGFLAGFLPAAPAVIVAARGGKLWLRAAR